MTRDGENGTKTGFYPVLVQMCAPVQTIYTAVLCSVYMYLFINTAVNDCEDDFSVCVEF